MLDVPNGTGFRGMDDRGGIGGAGPSVPRSDKRLDLRGDGGSSEVGLVPAISSGCASSSSLSMLCRTSSMAGTRLGMGGERSSCAGIRDSLGRGAMAAQRAR